MSTTRVDNTPNAGATGGKDPISESETNAAEYKKMMGDSAQTGGNEMAYYLKLQRAMMQEQQAYMALSNIMKAKDDAAKNSINNVK
jgi:hypothetical protein